MKVLVTGSHGLVGSRLVKSLIEQKHEVVCLVRANPQANQLVWDPENGSIDPSGLEGFNAVVHLAGDNIADGRWTQAKKERIRRSRVEGTTLLCKALSQLANPPATLISASAIGIYGDRGEEILNESSSFGKGFLADVCREWEAATQPIQNTNIRLALLRTGVVLATTGGALTKMLLPFQVGAGGILGNGKQYMSWIALDDLVGAINFILTQPQIEGPVNAVAPNPVTNRQFTDALGAALHKPTVLPLPSFAAKLIMGQMADELLLSSQRVQPQALLNNGYAFKQPDLRPFLEGLFQFH